MDESHFIPLHSAVKLKKLFSVRKQFFETLSSCAAFLSLYLRQDITSLAYPDGFRQAQALWLCQLRQSGLSAPSPCCGKHFRLVSCLENIIVHGEVAFDAVRFRISPALSKEKSVR